MAETITAQDDDEMQVGGIILLDGDYFEITRVNLAEREVELVPLDRAKRGKVIPLPVELE